MPDRHCPKCGATLKSRAPSDLSHVLSEVDVARLVDLFSGKLDRDHCPACSETLDSYPTVAVRFSNPCEIFFVRGSASGATDELVANLRRTIPAAAQGSVGEQSSFE